MRTPFTMGHALLVCLAIVCLVMAQTYVQAHDTAAQAAAPSVPDVHVATPAPDVITLDCREVDVRYSGERVRAHLCMMPDHKTQCLIWDQTATCYEAEKTWAR